MNNVNLFGYQLIVDEDENITEEEEKLLISALTAGIEEIAEIVHVLKGLFVPAHISKKRNGIIEQLGFLPEDLQYDALELPDKQELDNMIKVIPNSSEITFLLSSDAHIPEDIGKKYSIFEMEKPDFEDIFFAFKGLHGRRVTI